MVFFRTTLRPWHSITIPDNNMPSSLFRRLVCLAAVCMASMTALAEDPHDSIYRLVLTVGGGGSLYTGEQGPPSWMSAEKSKFGPAMTFRVMWRPDHLLSVGLESGWTKFHSYETSGDVAGKVYVSQIPLYTVFSMRFWDALNVFGGYGYSIVNSNLEYAGTVNNTTWSMGWLTACSYERSVSKTLGVAAELKYINAIESHDAAVTLQIQLVWSFLEW
jgi:hypothetical protein